MGGTLGGTDWCVDVDAQSLRLRIERRLYAPGPDMASDTPPLSGRTSGPPPPPSTPPPAASAAGAVRELLSHVPDPFVTSHTPEASFLPTTSTLATGLFIIIVIIIIDSVCLATFIITRPDCDPSSSAAPSSSSSPSSV